MYGSLKGGGVSVTVNSFHGPSTPASELMVAAGIHSLARRARIELSTAGSLPCGI